MDLITIDFETAYDKEYSLSKMTTEAYIRDRRFEVIGVGVKINDGPTDWYSGNNPGKFLGSLDYSKYAVLCHHAAFDGAILSWKYGIKPKLWLDTLSMARPLHSQVMSCSLASLSSFYGLGEKGTEVINALGKWRKDFTPQELAKYGEYCCNDVELTYALFQKLKGKLAVKELLAIDTVLRMFTEPMIVLDQSLLADHLADVLERKDDHLSRVAAELGVDKANVQTALMSTGKFADLLYRYDVIPPVKLNSSGEQTYAFAKTDQGLLDLLEHPEERVSSLVAARLGVKSTIEETRTRNLINASERGAMPVMLNNYGAHTTRLTGGDGMNFQNLPSRGNNTIRRSLTAPAGHTIIACDSSQIEARTLAWLAGQEDLVDAFREGRDVYSEFATEVYGKTITKADKIERFVGKTCVLGLGYGLGAIKLQKTLKLGAGGVSVDVTIDEAKRIVQIYRRKYWKIPQLWNVLSNTINQMLADGEGSVAGVLKYKGKTIGLSGYPCMTYPLLRQPSNVGSSLLNNAQYVSKPRDYKKATAEKVSGVVDPTINWEVLYGGKFTENCIQYLAAIINREFMVAIARKYRVILQVHDELVVCVPDEQADEAERYMISVMNTPPVWASTLPVACESGRGNNYGDC
jgi:DNA polymerase